MYDGFHIAFNPYVEVVRAEAEGGGPGCKGMHLSLRPS